MKMKYTNLGSSGLKVSRICVGCMSFGDRRGRYKWCVEEAESLPILKACYDAGINFFDTANLYSSGVSEEILGKAIKKYEMRRENLVVATKVFFAVGWRAEDGPNNWFEPRRQTSEELDALGFVNHYGLSRKHIFASVDASLKRLRLEYIDLLQIHRFDPNTPIKETMKALHDVVESGKVRYIGASSMCAHQLLEMQYTARINGWTEFISMQNQHSPVYREEEREMIPSLEKFGMGMIPWSPLAEGYLARPHEKFKDSSRGESTAEDIMKGISAADEKTNRKIEDIAKKRETSMAIVTLAWSLSKPFMTAPIVGISKIERV